MLMKNHHQKLIDEMLQLGEVIYENGVYLSQTVKFTKTRRTKLPPALHMALLYINKSITKRCNVCEMEKDRRFFDWHSYKQDGLQPFCRSCKNEKQRLQNQKHRQQKRTRKNISAKLKLEIIARDGGKCLLCNNTVALQVHHIIPVKNLPQLINEADNLATVCKKCHYSSVHPNTRTYDRNIARKLLSLIGFDISKYKKYAKG